jgi:tetratricopeptide (TPR) repeat protein
MGLGTMLCALAATLQSPAADSLRTLALRVPESTLAMEARERPLVMREAISDALARALRVPGAREVALASARRLASAMAIVWRDSFLVRRVDRMAALGPSERALQSKGDSLRRAGVSAFTRQGPASAIRMWTRAVSALRAVGDTAGLAATLDNIGAGHMELRRIDSAEHYLLHARRLAIAAGDLRVQANAVGHLADLAAERGALADARAGYVQSRTLRERIGDDRGVAADLNNLGLLAQDLGDNVEARRQFEAALAINRARGRPEVAATNLVNLAGLAALEGEFAKGGAARRARAWRRRMRPRPPSRSPDWGSELRRGDYPAARRPHRSSLTPIAGSVDERVLCCSGGFRDAGDQGSIVRSVAGRWLMDTLRSALCGMRHQAFKWCFAKRTIGISTSCSSRDPAAEAGRGTAGALAMAHDHGREPQRS